MDRGKCSDTFLQHIAHWIGLGLHQCGSFAVDRVFMTRLSPEKHLGEFYGLYSTVGRFATIIGPILWGLIVNSLGLGRNVEGLFVLGEANFSDHGGIGAVRGHLLRDLGRGGGGGGSGGFGGFVVLSVAWWAVAAPPWSI